MDSLRGAIVGLGFQRVSDIAMSCGVLNLMPKDSAGIDPVVFWEHSLGCALVCRHFARKISYPDPSKAYLAGLLHDLGIIVNLWVLPKEFRAAFEFARAEEIPLHEAEQSSWDSRIAKAAAYWRKNGNFLPTSARSCRCTTTPRSRAIMPDSLRWWNSATCSAA